MSSCEHTFLSFGVVDSVQFKYRQPTEQVRRKALAVSGPTHKKRKINHVRDERADAIPETWSDATTFNDNLFPAPIVLPGHEMALHPKYPPQSVREWLEEPNRNEVTSKRNIIVRALTIRLINLPA